MTVILEYREKGLEPGTAKFRVQVQGNVLAVCMANKAENNQSGCYAGFVFECTLPSQFGSKNARSAKCYNQHLKLGSPRKVEMLKNPVWQVVGVIVGIAAIFVTIIIYNQEKPVKRLQVEILSNNPLVSITEF
jgi:hypothetical protein